MKYKLLRGDEIDTAEFPQEDIDFILSLYAKALNNADYFDLIKEVCGPNAFPLKGSARVTREIHNSALYRVAEDIVDRVGVQQGIILPDDNDEMAPIEAIMSAKEAADELGISRTAVVRAANRGTIKGKKVGRAWALLRESVESYQVSEKRVAAGKRSQETFRMVAKPYGS